MDIKYTIAIKFKKRIIYNLTKYKIKIKFEVFLKIDNQ